MLPRKTKALIKQYRLLSKKDLVLVAYSGGPDSTCLLLLLQELQYKLAAVYVNHQLRDEESAEEERFVRDFCSAHDVPLFVERMQWKKKPANMEEAARRKRYRHFVKVATEGRFTKVALAHTENDAAETFLLRLFRGSGPSGLAALQPRRGIYVRPLLTCNRKEVLDFLEDKKARWFEDTSNTSLQFQRNRVRHELLPYLEKNFNPRVLPAIARALEWLKEQNDLNSELVKPYARRIRVAGGKVLLSRRGYLRLSPPLRKAVLRMALEKADASFQLSSRLLSQMDQAVQNSQNLELPGFLLLKCSSERISFALKQHRVGYTEVDVPHEGIFSYPIAGVKLKFYLRENLQFQRKKTVAYLDASKATFPLHIRNWKKGDFFQPLGMEGHKKLSDFWIDRKVPRVHRKKVPLIFKDDDLVWVAGYEIDHKFRVSEQTKHVLCIELLESNV